MAEKVSKINGVLLPGGGAALEPGHPFFDAVAHLVNLTKEANDAGEYFPVCEVLKKLGAQRQVAGRSRWLANGLAGISL